MFVQIQRWTDQQGSRKKNKRCAYHTKWALLDVILFRRLQILKWKWQLMFYIISYTKQTAYSQFGMDILIRSVIIHYRWPNMKRASLGASIIWFWTNSQRTSDWDVMTRMYVMVVPMLQNAISQTPQSHLGMNNLRSVIIYHKQLKVVFIQLFGNRWFIINSMFLKWFARNCEHIIKCFTLLLILRVW